MRKSRSIAIFAACVFLSLSVRAQEQKFGYVNTDIILSQIPEYQNIQQELDLISKEWRDQLNAMQQEIDTLREDFSSKEILYTDEIRKQREEEIEQKVRQRQQYLDQKFGPEGEYFKQQQELLEPIQRRVYEAISVIAQREDFDFIFDRSQNASLLYSDVEWNLNDKVLQELGIPVDAARN